MLEGLVTVIVPVYNVEQYLLRCVESIQSQSYQNLEIILVDDASPDNCPQMCDQLALQDARIKVVHKENGGLGFARNSGLDAATGSYVTFIDSDDWISKCHIENLLCQMIQNSADVVIGSHTSVNGMGVQVPHFIQLEEGVYEGDEIKSKILLPLFGADIRYPDDLQMNASSCMNLYRMEFIQSQRLRFISERYAISEDLYFNIDVFYFAKKVVALNELGYYYYQNNESISRKYHPKAFKRTINYYYELQKKSSEYHLSDKIAYRIDRSFLMNIRALLRLIVLSDLSQKEKMQEIRKILCHDLVVRVVNAYPIHTFSLSHRVFAFLMRAKCAIGVYCMIKLREAMRE